MHIKLHIVVFPLVAAALLGGCSRDTTVVQMPDPGGTYLSTSAGATFEQSVLVEDSIDGTLADMTLYQAYRPLDVPQAVYIAAGAHGIVMSETGAAPWKRITTSLTDTRDVVALPNGILVASGLDAIGQGYVIRSLDEGKSWQTVLTVPVPAQKDPGFQLFKTEGAVASVVISIEIDPFNRDRVYAASNLGTIFVGEQSAKVWKTQHVEENGIRKIVASPYARGELLVITQDNILLRVNDDTPAGEEIVVPLSIDAPLETSTKGKVVNDVSFIPGFPDALLVSVDDGIAVTRDGGESWMRLQVPLEISQEFNTVVARVSPTNVNRILVAINNIVYRSEDGGDTWNTSIAVPAQGLVITDMSIDPSNASRVLLIAQPVEL